MLGLHDKPAALLDPDGYYDALCGQLDLMVADGYLGTDQRQALARVRDVDELLAWYATKPHSARRWYDRRA
jgi:hypothetical protein